MFLREAWRDLSRRFTRFVDAGCVPIVGRFLARAALGLAAAAVVYRFVRESYQSAVVDLGGALLGWLEPGVGLALLDGGARVAGADARVAVTVERTSLDLILVGSVLLVALLAGTPRLWRGLRSWGALAALLVLQVVVLVGASLGSYWKLSGQPSVGSEALGLLGAYGGLILPVPLWLWAGGADWLFPRRATEVSTTDAPAPVANTAPRNGPCPCGCGRKAKHCRRRPLGAV